MTTGNIELDLAERIAELLPERWRTSDRRNVWDGGEVPAGGEVAEDALFITLVTTKHDLWGDSQVRYVDLEVLRRFSRAASRAARLEARAETVAIYEALHLSGAFTGASSGGEYLDIRALDSPVFLPNQHYALNVTLWRVD